jgi:hypothetical protein
MLRTWFRWRGNNSVRKTKPIVIVPSLPRSRQNQDTEIYSKLFYESKLKRIIDAEVAGLSNSEKLAKIVEVTRREWEGESDEVRAQVKAMKEDQRHSPQPLGDSATPSPEQRQAAINELGYTASAFLDHVQKTTGWTGFMVLGGPKPDIGDEMAIGS